MAIMLLGVMSILTDLSGRAASFGPAAWMEFDGPVLVGMMVVTAGVLATILLVIVRRVRSKV